jgi:ectoine hydroxylase-related dioxygenase (phytanoyl-CoA dioxygenase family)
MNSNVGHTTWHQDIVALLPDADETTIVTVWVALTDASIENGCLVSVPGSHRLGCQVHCANAEIASEPYVPAAVLAGIEEQPLPVGRGGVVLFDKLNVHCSLPNRSSKMRWSADLRYNVTGQGTGRPAFPGFVARSAVAPESVLADYDRWRQNWADAKHRIIAGEHGARIFEDARWNDPAVC